MKQKSKIISISIISALLAVPAPAFWTLESAVRGRTDAALGASQRQIAESVVGIYRTCLNDGPAKGFIQSGVPAWEFCECYVGALNIDALKTKGASAAMTDARSRCAWLSDANFGDSDAAGQCDECLSRAGGDKSLCPPCAGNPKPRKNAAGSDAGIWKTEFELLGQN